jgi:hypothetical protein
VLLKLSHEFFLAGPLKCAQETPRLLGRETTPDHIFGDTFDALRVELMAFTEGVRIHPAHCRHKTRVNE